jgi:hypothetical protein
LRAHTTSFVGVAALAAGVADAGAADDGPADCALGATLCDAFEQAATRMTNAVMSFDRR